MRIDSINVGQREFLTHGKFSGDTGIRKRPVTDPVEVTRLGITGDAVLNKRHHGGPDQAVYLYRSEDYAWWSGELGQTVEYGRFGDNLTVSGLPDPNLPVGTQLVFPAVTLEITAPRIPCSTLAACMGATDFVSRFVEAERPGLYCRVIRPGLLQTGDEFTLLPYAGDTISTLDLYRARYRRLRRAEIVQFLAAPIDIRTRRDLQRDLAGRDPALDD